MKLAVCCINALGWKTVRHRWQECLPAAFQSVEFFHPEDFGTVARARGFRTFAKSWAMRRAVQSALRSGADRVLIATNGEANLIGASAARRLAVYGDASHRDLDQLYEFHRGEWKNASRDRSMRRLVRHGARFIAMSTWAAEGFEKHYGAPTRILPPPIDTCRFGDSGDHGWDPFQILFVGGNFVRKGGDVLLDVMVRLPQAKLHVVSNEVRPDTDQIKWHGPLAPDSIELVRLYQTSSVFCLPTRADCYSHVAIESQACGLPVLIHPTGGISDLLDSGRTGVEISLDPAEIALTITSLSMEQLAELSRAGRERAVAHNDYRVHAERLVQLLA